MTCLNSEAFERLRTYCFHISHMGDLMRQSLGKYVRKIYICVQKQKTEK